MSSIRRLFQASMVVLPLLAATAQRTEAQPSDAKRPLSIDDVLGMEQIDRSTLSPDGEWVAAVVRRPARAGEVYGRASYEVDPTRSDIWLISTKTGVRRTITSGAQKAAGFWCATWSPDGQRLAMLSTAPEGTEPRGGDNVRLYVWDRASDTVKRMTGGGLMTQTRYGSALNKLDLRGGADGGTVAHACSTGVVAENAPFLWLDAHRVLIVALPDGEVSAAIDQFNRPFRAAARDASRLRDGVVSSVSVVASGAARTRRDDGLAQASLQIVDVRTGEVTSLGDAPAYPFRGSLSASVSPDGSRLAVLATATALQPQSGSRFPNDSADGWTVERRLGFVDLKRGSALRWTTMPAAARYPLELYGWSPNSQAVALRARSGPFVDATPLFVANAKRDTVTAVGPRSIGDDRATVGDRHPAAAAWVDDRRLAARATDGKWWLTGVDGRSREVALPAGVEAPDQFRRTGDGSLVALSGRTLLRLDPATATLARVADMGAEALFQRPEDADRPARTRSILLHRDDGTYRFTTLDTVSGGIGPETAATPGDVLDVDVARGVILYSESGRDGTYQRQKRLSDGKPSNLLALGVSLGQVDWGETRLIQYKDTAGAERNGSVILPPGYKAGWRYPTLVWVYAGYEVPPDLRGDYMTSPLMPGIYNLHLYAAKGYVVLVPSMPLGGPDQRRDIYDQIPKGVLPAVDRLVAMGIADPDRVGVFGQSLGGYSVYSLVTQTNCFKAAVAIAGLTDLADLYGQFDPSARGYSGIEHEKSDNWSLIGQFGNDGPPWMGRAGYDRNSPLRYVDRVRTPLLLIHGDMDIRGSAGQAEQFFYSLYAQGKTAEFARYGGESHSLAQSPANIRDVFVRTINWFDRYLGKPDKGDGELSPASSKPHAK